MDIWEANREANAFTSHPCSLKGPKTCSDSLECGESEFRYKGVCDKDGCDLNPYRSGDHSFYGNGAEYAVDSSKPFTIVTQWITDDGTDAGDLVEIRRLYVQHGKVIANSAVSTPGRDQKDDSITDAFCDAQKEAFGDTNEHKAKGGLKAMGEALDRGVVLALSIWDDQLTHMDWLDASTGDGSKPGDLRGPCKRGDGIPADLRQKHGDASVKYTNFMFGELDSTYTAGTSPKPIAVKTPPASQPVASQPNGPQPAPAPGHLSAFSQCGGKTWTGSTSCEPGCTCVASGEHYSQCVPPAGAWTCGMSAVGTVAERSGNAGKASVGRQKRLRARRENILLQRLGKLERSPEDRSDDGHYHGEDEL